MVGVHDRPDANHRLDLVSIWLIQLGPTGVKWNVMFGLAASHACTSGGGVGGQVVPIAFRDRDHRPQAVMSCGAGPFDVAGMSRPVRAAHTVSSAAASSSVPP